MRLDNCQVDLVIEGDPSGSQIAPLLLIPFVENAFKHVSDHPDGNNRITVRLAFSAAILTFTCSNTTAPKSAAAHAGVGLANVSKRLELIYGKDCSLEQQAAGGIYIIKLTLNLKDAELPDR